MTWNKTDFLLKKRLNQHGLGVAVEAGVLCRKAEELYPNLFEAVSVRNGSLHLKIYKKNQLAFTLIRGKLIEELNTFGEPKQLPKITRIRLTIEPVSAIL